MKEKNLQTLIEIERNTWSNICFYHTSSMFQELTLSDFEHFISFKLRSRMYWLLNEDWLWNLNQTESLQCLCFSMFCMSIIVSVSQQPSSGDLAPPTSLMKRKPRAARRSPALCFHPPHAQVMEPGLLWCGLPQEKLQAGNPATENPRHPPFQLWSPGHQAQNWFLCFNVHISISYL